MSLARRQALAGALADGEAAIRQSVALALLLSAGLHLLVLLTLDGGSGAWRPGVLPALQVSLLPQASVAQLPGSAAPGASPGTEVPARAPLQPPVTRSAPEPLERDLAARGLRADRSRSGSSLPSAEQYFRKNQLDVAAFVVDRPALVYPEDAFIMRMAGSVRARVFINEAGDVDRVQVEYANPPGIFEFAAVTALRRTRYHPASIAGVPVKSQKLVEVTFDPHEGNQNESSRANN